MIDSVVKCGEEKEKGMSKSGREPCSGCSRIPVRKLGSCEAAREKKRERENARALEGGSVRSAACQSGSTGRGLYVML